MYRRKVLVFGTFDHLHPGHIYFLKQAQKLGDVLAVIVARDNNVEKIKDQRPDDSEGTRLKAIKNLNFVNKVFLGEENLENKYSLIQKIKPDIIALGYDQKNFTEDLPKHIGKNTEIVRLKPFKPDKYKSSIIRQRKNGD